MEQVQKFIYFASDFHLGFPNDEDSSTRESLILEWLNSIQSTCGELYLLGDIFDFWFEYKYVVPMGFVRLLAKLAEFTQAGIPVNLFCGNHDLWYGQYLEREIGVKIFKEPQIREYFGKKFFIHHGHALGKYDKGMNFLNGIFDNRFLQWLFAFVPTNWAYGFGRAWSRHNRKRHNQGSHEPTNNHPDYLGDDKEFLVRFATDVLKTEHYDYFVFGHRHVAANKPIAENSHYINLGNWIYSSTYAVASPQGVEVLSFKGEATIIR